MLKGLIITNILMLTSKFWKLVCDVWDVFNPWLSKNVQERVLRVLRSFDRLLNECVAVEGLWYESFESFGPSGWRVDGYGGLRSFRDVALDRRPNPPHVRAKFGKWLWIADV